MANKKVMVGMSGGVDSSVCAVLLSEAGYSVTGVTLRLYDGEDFEKGITKTCSSLTNINDAKAVCDRLNIPHFVFDFKEYFCDTVISNFINEYKEGRTPNPCIVCNRKIKFAAMLDRADELGYDKIATGHYAIVERNENGRYILKKAADKSKDQTYVLYSLTQAQLSKVLFPLGKFTKPQVREIAEKNGFVNAEKPDSQDICFVPDGDYANFIERISGEKSQTGDFIDRSGKKLGTHKGVIRYTIGQRKGLGIALGKQVFVLDKDSLKNTVTLGDEDALFYKRVLVKDLNFIPFDKPESEIKISAKLRYRHTEQPARLNLTENGCAVIEFEQPQRAPSPGQSAVFYDGDIVVGGGTIVKGID